MTIMIALAMIAMTTSADVADCAAAETTIEIQACAERERHAADAELNRYWRAATTRLEGSPDTLAQLRRSETAWIAHRDAECEAVRYHWGPGTLAGIETAVCMTRATRARTMAIWRNWLTHSDSTPPILPRPDMVD